MHHLIHIISCIHTNIVISRQEQCAAPYANLTCHDGGRIEVSSSVYQCQCMRTSIEDTETKKEIWTYVLFASALVGDLGGHNADKDTDLVSALVDFVGRPIDALQGCLGDNI